MTRHRRTTTAALLSLAGLASAAVLTTSTTAQAGSAAGDRDPLRAAASHYVTVSGLDNPRQLSLSRGRIIVAEAGHGDPAHCSSTPMGDTCIGSNGKVSIVLGHGRAKALMGGLISGAGPDGTFATGADGAGRIGRSTYGIVTYAPPDLIPAGLPGKQAGKLVVRRPGGKLRIVADVTGYERRNDVDGEGFDSNPYSLLALKKKVLVADAAGDYIAQVKRRNGRVSVWAKMPEYGAQLDAVPTVVTKGADGKIYVGELHSEVPDAAKVHRFSRSGKHLRAWAGFTTVTGVAVDGRGRMYVSELFGGDCGFDQIPTCFPGRVVRVMPNGTRSSVDVPFPAGIVVRKGVPYVAAFSVAPKTGFGGNPAWAGQIWRLRNF